MLDKALQIGFSALPDMKEKQNSNIGTVFPEKLDHSGTAISLPVPLVLFLLQKMFIDQNPLIIKISEIEQFIIPKEIGFCPIHIIRKRLPDSFS